VDSLEDKELAGLREFNGLPADAARPALMNCCPSSRWVGALQAGRPYDSVASLLRHSDESVAGLTPDDLRDALSGHPRIGEQADGGNTRWSREEQAGVAGVAGATRRALADGNAAYEQRFGHIYLVCATGKPADKLLALLQERLTNDRDTEWRVVRSELRKINRIRLRKLIGELP
jgi:2-oxo-4-hydroxy-4-carboxy-5-ureidoimidazoline decarboxylase